jgi:chromosome partitioning protein
LGRKKKKRKGGEVDERPDAQVDAAGIPDGEAVASASPDPQPADNPEPRPPSPHEETYDTTDAISYSEDGERRAVQPGAPPAPPMGLRRPTPRIVAVANQKGGVGKTTTAVNVAAALAALGYRILLVDLDPQGNAGTGVGLNVRELDQSIYDVLLHDVPMADCVHPTEVDNLFVVPSTQDLAGAEIELVPAFSREHRLRTAVATLGDAYDFIFIDCPPSLGLLTVNAFTAATEVMVPIQCEYYALEGLGQLMGNVDLVRRNLNPTLEVSAIVLVMYDSRTRLAAQVVDEVRAHFGDRVCRTVVPRSVRLSEAPSYGQPVTVFDPLSRGAVAYRDLAQEVSDGTPQRTR